MTIRLHIGRAHGRTLRQVLGGLILLGFVVAVELYLGWAALLKPWTDIPAGPLGIAVALAAASQLARAARIHDYFRPVTTGRFQTCLRLFLLHNFFNNMIPMRLGEASFPLLMRRYFRLPVARTLSALLWFRLLDLHALVGVAIAALGLGVLAAGPLALLLAAWLGLPWLAYRLRRGLGPALVQRLGGRLGRKLEQALQGLPANLPGLWRNQGWTLLAWVSKLAVFAWLLHVFSGASPAASVGGAIAGEFTSVLPVHGFAGAGTYEGGVLAGLMPAGIPLREALTAAVNLHLFLLGLSLVGAALALGLRREHLNG